MNEEKIYKFFSVICYIIFGIGSLIGILTFSKGGFIALIFGFLFLWIAVLCNGLSKPTENYKETPSILISEPIFESPRPVTTPVKEIPQPKKEPPKTKTFKVAGISSHREKVLNIASENSDYDMGKRAIIEAGLANERIYKYEFYPSKVELVPEPDNPHDPKAVKVVVDGEHIGYIKEGSRSHVLNLLSQNLIKKIDCEIYGGNYKILSWDEFDDEDPGEIEKDATEFGAKVIITLKENEET